MALLETVLIPVIIGSVTGLASHLITNQYVAAYPQKEEEGFYFGFLAHMLIGALAALAAVNVIVPNDESYRHAIGISVLAAMSGETFLLRNALQNERAKKESIKSITDKKNEEID